MFGASKSGKVVAASPAATDPQFNYVTALFNGDGTNGAQNNTFLDSSTNNFTITRNGTPTQGSAAPFGPNWSNTFNGSNGTLLNTPSSTVFNLGAGDFTVEGWFNFNSLAIQGQEMIRFDGATAYNPFMFVWNDGTIYLRSSLSTNMVAPFAHGMVTGVWYHWALCRVGNVYTVYKNGTSIVSVTSTAIVSENKSCFFGKALDGYISNYRVVNGTAVYTANFTPPTAPLTAITNTSLLTCQSTYFKDNSSNNFTITSTGTPSVQRFSPFNNTASYSPSVYGGAMYFNGSTDWLGTISSTAFQLGTGAFTMEAWIYPTATPSVSPAFIVNNIDTSSGNTQCGISFSTANKLVFQSWNAYILIGSININLNTWSHVAISFDGTTYKTFVNGVLDTSGTTLYNFSSAGPGKVAYALGGVPLFTGYISNARIVKGTAVYTANFTPPTAPLTAITNTSLLLSGTNAGIYDSAMITTEITAGSAQISTTQKKYGTGSLYFTGTGAFLQAPNSPNYAFGTGAFTIECWIYTSAYANATLVDTRSTTSSTLGTTFGVTSSGQVVFNGYSPAGTFSLNTWTYLTVALDSGLFGRVWIDGVYKGGAGFSGTSTDQFLTIGNSVARSGTGFLGYIDDLRITKGYARYTSSANFTPPTQSLPTS